jgi:DNA polymerase I
MPWDNLSEIWCADFEFQTEEKRDGGRPIPVCLVARGYHSNCLIRIWRDELIGLRRAPFDTGPGAALCAYFASAELGCFLTLGWPLPYNVIDLYAEFRLKNNNGPLDKHRSLTDVMRDNGLPFMSEAHKTEMRRLVTDRDEWSAEERKAILDYCQEDTDATVDLLARAQRFIDLPRSLLRGRYVATCARIEQTGIPLDVPVWNRITASRIPLLNRIVREEDKPFGVYGDGLSWSDKRFDELLRRRRISWPRTPGIGRPVLEKDTFERMCEVYPDLRPLLELKHTIRMLMEPGLAIGPDDRNRIPVSPFGSKTGRNTPKARQYIFGQARWLRGLIRPVPGRSLAYIDWEAQEIAIAAALSRDERLLEAYLSGDPYLAFAVSVGLAPEGATKTSHMIIRDLCKVVYLATIFGQTAVGLAARLRISLFEAADLLRLHHDTYSTFWRWMERTVERADLTGRIRTKLGWSMPITDDTSLNSLMNWPMQAHGAELMRLAAIAMTEADVSVCTPVHDAFLIEALTSAVSGAVETSRAIMQQAGVSLLGIPIRTEANVFHYPERFRDDKDDAPQMWSRVMSRLIEIEGSSIIKGAEEGLYGCV